MKISTVTKLVDIFCKFSETKLYHGSPSDLDILKPGNQHGDPDIVDDALFASPSRSFALAYSGKKWGDKDIEQNIRGGGKKTLTIQLREMRPGAFKDIYDCEGFMYEVPADKFKRGPRRASMELLSDEDVKPIKKEKIKNVLKELEKDSLIELHEYDPEDKATSSAIKRQVKRMRSFDDKGAKEYRKWRLKGVPEEIKQLWESEEAGND